MLNVQSVTVKKQDKVVLHNVNFSIRPGEQWAVAGPSGSGKTTLLLAIAGRHAYDGVIVVGDYLNKPSKMVLVMQQHRFRNLSNTADFYYQQRYNAFDAENSITVNEDLQRCITANEITAPASNTELSAMAELLHIKHLLPARLIQLSNGENKRLQIAKALLLHPSILLLDSPFTGLDAAARTLLAGLLQQIISKGVHILLATTPGQVPACITHVLTLEKGGAYVTEKIAAFRMRKQPAAHVPAGADESLLKMLAGKITDEHFQYAVKMKAVTIRYNNRLILDHINWEIAKGDRWALSGPNGSGKSTLLSCINADNPQAYANEIYLFDRRRGTGESIWDIKKRIGFLSPELHVYFDTSAGCFNVIASGLFDTIGLFRPLNTAQTEVVNGWMQLLHLQHLRNLRLMQLSAGEQRLVLLARALVKNPSLLILDEPCQGLDDEQVASFKAMVDTICLVTNKTLIYVSHYPHEIPSCVNKFMRLEEGRQEG